MRKPILYILLIFFCSCSSKKTPTEKIVFKPVDLEISDTVVLWEGDPLVLFPVYLDSIKKFKPGMPLPAFVYNYLLDYEHPWMTDHWTSAFRKVLFDSTWNRDFLHAIINSNDPRLRMIANLDSVPDRSRLENTLYREISTYEMAKQRLRKLSKRKKIL